MVKVARCVPGRKYLFQNERNGEMILRALILICAMCTACSAALTVYILPDSTRVCYLGKPIEIDLVIKGDVSSEFKGTLQLELVDYWGKQAKVHEQPVKLANISRTEVAMKLGVSEVGYYEINLKLIAKSGTVLEQKKVWSVAVFDHPRNFPSDSPLGTYIIGMLDPLAEIVPMGFYENMAQMGARWGTIDLCWKYLEPEQGKYNWAYYDKWFTKALNAGITPIPHLYGIPRWASSWRPGDPGDAETYPPIYLEQWERFVYDFVNHYKDWLVYLRIWNEPNLESFHGTPAEYAKLAKIAYQAAKRAKPDIKVIIEAAATWEKNPIDFFNAVYKADDSSYYDVIGIHNYLFNNANFPEKTQFLPMYDKFIEWRNKNKPNVEAWDTEFACMADNWVWFIGVGEKHQAQWLGRTHVLGFAKGLKKMIWFPGYSWPIQEKPYYNPAGLIRVNNLTPRPAYVAYHTMASALSWAKYECALSLPDDRYGMVFKIPEGYVTAMWSVNANSACPVKLEFEQQQQKISVVDIMGRTSEKALGGKGEMTVDVSEDIIYVYSKSIPKTELTVGVLPDSTRVCYLGKPIEIDLVIKGDVSSEFKGTLQLELVDYWGKKAKVHEQPVKLVNVSRTEVVIKLGVSEVGYYEINLKLIAESGMVLEQKKVWSVAVFDHPRNFPSNSPLGTYTIGCVNLLADIVPRGFYENMAQVGARWGTIDTWWKELEPEKGKYNWAYYDKWFNEALKAGITPIPHLYAIPQWTSSWKPGDPGDSWTYPPIDWDQWERFVYDFVNHYKDWLIYLRIWNEPNLEYWHGTPAEYAKLAKIAYQAARRAKPDIKIIIEAAATWEKNPVDFFDAVYKADDSSYYDIIAIHNYRFNDANFPEKTQFLPTYDRFIEWRNKNKPNVEAWDTEFACMADNWVWFIGVGEKHQAQWLGRTHVLGFAKGLKKMFWFPGYSWGVPEEPYYNPAGLLRADLTPRPAYVAYHTMASALSWAKYERALLLPGDRYGVVFKIPEGYVTTLWSVDANSACPVKLRFEQQQKISVVDIMGRTSEKALGSKGEMTVDISEDIIYVYSKTVPDVNVSR